MTQVYQERRDIMVQGLRDAGYEVTRSRATFYLWVTVPQRYTSTQLATRFLEEAGVVVTPGNGFGEPGEGYFRIALTQKKERLAEALKRMKGMRL
jgi:LL-diaminopimelate aminotransferase